MWFSLLKYLLVVAGSFFVALQASAASCPALLDHTFPRLWDDAPRSLNPYQGKAIFAADTGNFFGFTGQHDDFESVYDKCKDHGLVAIGLTSTDFGDQRPPPQWNIHKLLFDRSSSQVESDHSRSAPDSRPLIAHIEPAC